MARMDSVTLKMDAQYKELQTHAKKTKPDLNEDDIPMSREEEAKFMQTFPIDQLFRQEDVIGLKTQLETVAKNHQASIQNLETKFNRLADKQSGQPSGSLPSNTQPNPKGHNSKVYQPPQSRNEHVNAVFTRSVLTDLVQSITLMLIQLYAKLSLENLKPTKMSVRLADRSFQCPLGIAENMLVKVGKFTFPADFVILKMEKDSKVPLILGRPFLHTADAVIRVKQKQLNLGVGTERMIFNIDSAMKHSYSNDDTCFSIDVIDKILEEDFDALLNEGSKILHSIEGTLLEEEIFAEFDEFMEITADENSNSESNTEDLPFEKIAINTDYKIKTSLEEPPTDLKLKPFPDNLEYVFLEEPSFLPVIISSQLSKEKKNKLIYVLKKHKQAFAWKTTDIPVLAKEKMEQFGKEKSSFHDQGHQQAAKGNEDDKEFGEIHWWHRYSNPMIQPELDGSTQGYPLVSVKVLRNDTKGEKNIRVISFTMKMEILLELTSKKLMVEHAEQDESNAFVLERFNTTAGNPIKNILLKLNLSDHMSILTDSYSTEKLKAARDRQKSYADKRRKPLEFEVGDRVLLRVSPWKGVVRFGKKDANLHVPLDEIKVDKTLCFVEEPVEIMNREIRKLKRRKIVLVIVKWNLKRGPEFTSEHEDQIRIKYPQLFVDRVVEPTS
ncbi:reverse transcriptase domain-containing protein [Tanacetum coccineum]